MKSGRARPSGSLLLAAGLALTPAAGAADYAGGLEAWEQARFGLAHERWLDCARTGSARCQYALARLLEEGHGAPPAPGEALRWYRLAAAQDDPEALMRLGFLFAIGNDDVPQDPVQAWAWFARAAAIGVPQAAGNRDRVGALLTEEERREAERRADALSIRYHLQK